MKPGYPHNGITTALFKPVAAALSIVALLAGCGSVEAKDSKTEIASIDKVVSVNITEPSNGLLPSDTSDMSGWKIVSQLYDGLVTFDASGNETLVEAESITPNDDASEYTIVIKPDLAFSNGEKITAKPMRGAGHSRPMRPMGRWGPPFSKTSGDMTSCRMRKAPRPPNYPASTWWMTPH